MNTALIALGAFALGCLVGWRSHVTAEQARERISVKPRPPRWRDLP